MNRAVAASATAALIAAVGAAFVVAGPQLRPAVRAIAMIGSAAAEEGRAPIYFQDPNGQPSYSLVPRKTPDGRDYRAVPAGADVSFDDDASSVTPATAAAGRLRRAPDQILSQPHGPAGHVPDAEEGFHGDGLRPGL